MNCPEIQERLSAFIDGIVPPEEKMLIEDHLKLCSKCNKSLADLRKTIDYVHSLEDIEPPAWLRQKIIAAIEPEAKPKKGILKKLFYPLYIKLPIEAAAVILIAVTALHIFKTIQPEVKIAKTPSEEITTQIPLPSSPPLEKTTPSSPPLEKGPMARSQRLIEGKGGFEAEHPVPAKKPAIMDKSAEEPQAPAQVARQNEVRPPAGAVSKEEPKTEVLSPAAKPKMFAERKEAVSVSIRVKDIKTAREEIEKTLIQLEGKITKTESFENKELVTVEIDSQKMKEFIGNLERIGEIKEKELTFESLEGDIQIRVEIVKIATQLQ